MKSDELESVITKNLTFDHRRINVLAMGFNCYAHKQLNKSQIYSPSHIFCHATHPYDLDYTPQYELIKREFCDFTRENVKGKTYYSDNLGEHTGFVMGPDQFYYAFPHYNIRDDNSWENLVTRRIKSLMDRLKQAYKPRLLYTYVDRYGYTMREPNKEPVYIKRDFDKESSTKLIDNTIKFHYDLLDLYPCIHQKFIVGVGSNNPDEILQPIIQMDDIEIRYVHNMEWSKLEKIKKILEENNYQDTENVLRMLTFNHGLMNTGILAPHIIELIKETYKK